MTAVRSYGSILACLLMVSTLSCSVLAGGDKPSQNQAFNLKEFRGKLVYLDFWASWCGPCRASFPFMNALVSKYGDSLQVVTVNLDEDRDDANAFIAEFPPNFPVFYDPDGNLALKYRVAAMPNSFLFDRNGNLIFTHLGFTKNSPIELEVEIAKALAL
ncbi:Thiol-disulfide oxidoreductase ResA [Zhongshania aliphaticivorans]|uniref:Thiol-disulfide oxidoreductase ResA n=1 Tax=Zhongshania aliphaticivorans TaxID=1470434 RepID=A0A5S9MYR0_9GAMM|nr:TlpA disulfide reductase family protein [Zhongshania aliphaticivorans]CAA0082331.1 Thiol-disulfide oxidoreductase ResA [Zhongshania aliphaticivorans]CAA0084291.1 Thiol-disulfide oxidoreductase ResA [Zhongshania aliphaticivorans]